MTCNQLPNICILIISIIFVITGIIACGNHDEQNRNLIFTASDWYPAVDSFGSEYRIDGELITDGIATVSFTIAQRSESDDWIPWVELICDLGYTLENYSELEIAYKNDTDLLIKLSQSDFGEDGNQTYSHYEFLLPPAGDWNTHRVKFETFTQPDWTPGISKEIPLKLENVDAIYLVPDLDPAIGESSELSVRHLELFH